ncbi:hypothetical protein HHK36_032043 [Tetracentron sinense]|uniref:Uncharacterized protein n=1 Tax=Tetracentron sinense TaxID=13715 RepID=A0A834Y8S5_TETSI|nr:hypothetical protein HHK36_032043 [Tetracentron sinense]
MAQTILHYRTTLPDQFKKTFALVFASSRPVVPHYEAIAEPGIFGDCNSDAGERVESHKGSLVEEDPETAENIRLLKLKISSNVSTMPIIVKRMNECIYMIDKLDAYDGSTHLAFKRNRTS